MWQKEFRSADGISNGIEKTLLDKYPKEMDYNGKMLNLELRFNFRDPNVFKSNGHWYMTLGARDTTGHGGVIALFKTETDSIDSKWLPRVSFLKNFFAIIINKNIRKKIFLKN